MKERIMDRTQYTNLAKAWEFTEEHARERESDALTDTRTAADESGQLQGSAAQARLLGMLVRITGAASVIAVGTGSLVETLQLAHALDNKGLLTAVDSTAQGIALIRKAFAELQDETDTTLRAVNAPASVFLPRLNANDYDLIVVAGDAENYAATFAQASRLLRTHGVIVFTDVLALEDGQGGVINPADRSDKAIAMRELLTTVEGDEGFESTLTPDGTGLLIAYKK
ncbi:methyltransferase [Bifidobacterium longum subsp. longum]|nr:methyltransferase [Bifidobacterium longum subsp. longum]